MFDWRKLMWAGKAKLIFGKEGKRKQYIFKRHKDEKKDNLFYVYDKGYVGHIEKRGGHALLVLESPKHSGELQGIKVLEKVLECVSKKKELPRGWEVNHAGKCVVCARELTDPVSRDLGIGPVCRGR